MRIPMVPMSQTDRSALGRDDPPSSSEVDRRPPPIARHLRRLRAGGAGLNRVDESAGFHLTQTPM